MVYHYILLCFFILFAFDSVCFASSVCQTLYVLLGSSPVILNQTVTSHHYSRIEITVLVVININLSSSFLILILCYSSFLFTDPCLLLSY